MSHNESAMYHTATGTTPKQLVNTVRVSSATSAGVGHLIQLLATPPVPRDRRTLPAGPCDAVTMAVPRILGVALRECPQLPPTIAGRIKDYRAQNVADCVMYRNALASAAEWGWPSVACRGPRRSLPPGAEGRRAPLGPGSQARNGGGHITASAVVE